jgi:GNAT superfamily N-acetyltransferase
MAAQEPLVIPPEMLREANRHPAIKGFVKPDALRVPLVCDGTVAGFVTPHASKLGWRLSPVWVAPAYRGLGLLRDAWEPYRDRVCVAFISDVNTASAAAYRRAGFAPWRRGPKGYYWKREPCSPSRS